MIAPDVLWTELSPGTHVVQFYDDDHALIDTLEAYAAGGLLLGESVILVATASHLGSLRQRLRRRGMDVAALQIFGQLLCVDADELLARFMRDGRPDRALFEANLSELLERARGEGRSVRAFGEMVQLLWERGQIEATLELERLWQPVCAAEGLPLLCAYRKRSFASDDSDGIHCVCGMHDSVIS
jgi:hypothetical protein